MLHQFTSDMLAAPGGAVLASVGYGYDPNGNLTSKTMTGLADAAANTYTWPGAPGLTGRD